MEIWENSHYKGPKAGMCLELSRNSLEARCGQREINEQGKKNETGQYKGARPCGALQAIAGALAFILSDIGKLLGPLNRDSLKIE